MTRSEAARSLGVSVDFFDQHVAHEVRSVRRGRKRLYPVEDLRRWLDESAERAEYGCVWVVATVGVILHGVLG